LTTTQKTQKTMNKLTKILNYLFAAVTILIIVITFLYSLENDHLTQMQVFLHFKYRYAVLFLIAFGVLIHNNINDIEQ